MGNYLSSHHSRYLKRHQRHHDYANKSVIRAKRFDTSTSRYIANHWFAFMAYLKDHKKQTIHEYKGLQKKIQEVENPKPVDRKKIDTHYKKKETQMKKESDKVDTQMKKDKKKLPFNPADLLRSKDKLKKQKETNKKNDKKRAFSAKDLLSGKSKLKSAGNRLP